MSPTQLDLFSDNEPKRDKLGHSEITYKEAGSILTPTSGFMESYDYSINPYSGCSFGCTYCYAAFFSRDQDKMNNWGKWIEVKENALKLLVKKRKKPLIDKTIYISSVTDPYQPIEKDLELTRAILQELIDYHQVRLVIQTRSHLVERDIDLFKKFDKIQVNMTITTDSEEIRKVFEPYCPSNKMRLTAIKKIHESGVPACITLTPLLPVENANEFILALKETGIKKFIIQPFHADKGKFAAGTRDEAKAILNKYDWSQEEYERILNIFKTHIPDIGIGKQGFAPI
jgi:DNA repair photolyase